MPHQLELVIAPELADDPSVLRELAALQLGRGIDEVSDVRVRRRSIDARGARPRIRMQVDVYIGDVPPVDVAPRPEYRRVTGDRRVVIVGSGPAGLFAALRLVELGVRPIIVERGRDVRARRFDLAAIQRRGIVDPDSNYCFGEGGAGTYSDGKLYTRSTKRGDVAGALRTLVAHGADGDIMIDAHPHIGSNRLPSVVVAMRESIISAGGEIYFETRVTGFLRDVSGTMRGVVSGDGREFVGDSVILATGHSARDIFTLLHADGIAIESKPFAMGVRIEHPQPLIDRLQYHTTERNEHLPAASYRLASTVAERGVYSFCMCPGGFIVPSATEQDEVVVNGMSLSRRDSPFANSGIVVSVETEDLLPFAAHGPLAGVYYQKSIEVMAAIAGGGEQRAPAQRAIDFIAGRVSASLPSCSYKPGITSAPLHELLPADLASRLSVALKTFGRSMRGYLCDDATLIGVETRTSSPVRIPRDRVTLAHPDVAGLFPCGEGGGYAGGIISAALDGVRVAEAAAG